MVVQEDDAPMEAPLTKRTKYVVVKNHVRELTDEEGLSIITSDNTTEKSTANRRELKRKKGSQIQLPPVSDPTDISASDLEELQTVYRKCKAVLQKIESKYGHLLNLNDTESVESISNSSNAEPSCDYCSCSQKKKIVFDENGQRIEKDCVENHICIKQIKKARNDWQPTPSIQIEYDNISKLPNDLQELESILKDTTIDRSYRRMVIDKIYLLRQEYLNVIRFEKPDIIKQLRENPDGLLDFKGTNLSTLHGYPMKPLKKMKGSAVVE